MNAPPVPGPATPDATPEQPTAGTATLPSRSAPSGWTPGAAPGAAARSAPLLRLLHSELRWVLRRPRTIVMLALFALIPVAIGVGIAIAGSTAGDEGGLITAVAGNGLVLPVASLAVALTLLLPLGVAVAAADALAGESGHGTLRGLLLAPVGRLRLVGVKAVGVLGVAVLATTLIAVVGVVTGLLVVGNPAGGGELLTLSGATLGLPAALARVALAAGWVVLQLAAVGAVALAISSITEHPLVVLAVVLGGAIVFGVITAIPVLHSVQPWLLTSGWVSIADVLRDPLPADGLIRSSLRALCYLAVGLGLTAARMLTRDA